MAAYIGVASFQEFSSECTECQVNAANYTLLLRR